MAPAINFFALAGILIPATSLFMAVLMFFLGNRTLNRVWGFFCVAVFIWGLSFYFIANSPDPRVALFWWKISHIGVILIPVLFINFVYVFLEKINRPALVTFYCISGIFLLADLQTNLFIIKPRLFFGQFYYDSAGPLYLPFVIFFHGLIVYGHYLLLRAYLSSKDVLFKEQIRYFFMATIVGFLGGGLSFLPVFGINIYPYTILTVALYPVIMGYAILKYRLFDMRVVTAQIMSLLIFIFTFLKIFTSQSFIEYIINLALLFISLGLGAFLIRSVRKEIEAREIIEQQAKELESINNQQENLLHFISHEIKGYLTKSEAGFAAIVQGDFGPVSPQLASMADAALTDVRKGVRTVMDILDASNLKRGTVSYKKNMFDLRDVVSKVADHLKPAADEKHLTIETSIAWEVPCMVDGDEAKIREHVIRNLIDNAIKYTPAGTIKISLARTNDVVRFAVEDSGVGITPEDMTRLFTEGGHGKDSIKVNVHSTGYGLYIAKQVVDAHGGKIWAESRGAGKGSRFVVELPAA